MSNTSIPELDSFGAISASLKLSHSPDFSSLGFTPNLLNRMDESLPVIVIWDKTESAFNMSTDSSQETPANNL